MAKRNKKLSLGWIMCFTFLGSVSLALLVWVLLQGTDIALFHPKGTIATEERRLLVLSIVALFSLLIPTLIVLYFVAWRFRSTNTKVSSNPNQHYGKYFVATIWSIPTILMLILASIMWPATHKLAPQKTITSNVKPITIQVIAMRWKWLFIYPEQKVATVNFVQIPVNTPIDFELTADETPMSSFWIPHLGGQLYAMTGHVNQLNLEADTMGDYTGSSAEINGSGFAGMKFTTRVGSHDDFVQWVDSVQSTKAILGADVYQSLLTPSEYNVPAFYGAVESNLYGNMLKKYAGSHNHEVQQ